ncbi:MAG: DUF4160 domain-containing protein [Verrucomicrobia bacterium]|nr:DUF4160 domain-containing protein [Verrucomicrobiota bacterium]
MPTILRTGPYRLFCYSSDQHEPAHVHVERDDKKAKYWLKPIILQSSVGFARQELIDISRLLERNQELLFKSWNDYFAR